MKSRISQTLVLGIALATVGCTAGKDEVAKQVEEMKRELTTLRAEGAVLKDRIDMLESAPRAERVASEADAEPSVDRPSLEVVHLTPAKEPEAADDTVVAAPIDDSPPMDIVGDEEGVAEVDPNEPKAKTVAPPKRWRPRKPGHKTAKKGQ